MLRARFWISITAPIRLLPRPIPPPPALRPAPDGGTRLIIREQRQEERRLERKEDLPQTIREFIEFDGPAFLEVIIDRDAGVYPMVGPGLSYENMITGDWIRSREKPALDTLDPSEMF